MSTNALYTGRFALNNARLPVLR